jgi:UDP-N-acetylmuramoylalanine--D-glutamate ligase
MIPLPHTAGKTFAVFGMARSGLATARALAQSGARAVVGDDSDKGRQAARAAGFEPVDIMQQDFAGVEALCLSPGVPLTHPQPHPLVWKAKAAGKPVIGDMELFAQARSTLPPHQLVGVTGTNGKSTTTALIHHILNHAGRNALLGGNIGIPILEEEPLAEGGIYVLELSSFQIDLSHSLDCDVAVITNITPDHLDRHGDMAGYAAAKERLFTMQSRARASVVGQDDDWCRAIGERCGGRLRAISGASMLQSGIGVAGGRLFINGKAAARQADWPALQGPHNGQNVAAAVAACLALDLSAGSIIAALPGFPGLAHRMERMATFGGVLFVNDSKATNAASSAPALGAYPAIHWIVGGRRKTDDLDACLPYLGHVRAAYVIGESAALFETMLSPHLPVVRSETVAQAVKDAARAAKPGEVVLLSPACASQDQFRDYEERGDAFRAAVNNLGVK